MKANTPSNRNARTLVLLFVLLLAVMLVSLMVGRYFIPLSDVVAALLGRPPSKQVAQVVYQVRLPRIFAAVLVGGAQAVSGAAYQGMFKNPLVSPDLLGSSSGAAFGATLGIVLSLPLAAMKTTAFAFGLLAVLLAWFIGTKIGKGDNTTFLLVLAGILVGGLFQSLVNLMKYTADSDNKLPEITFWLMGSMSKATYGDVLNMLVPFVLCFGAMVWVSSQINILALGEEEARSLGVNARALQILIVVAATVLTSWSVSVTGMVGWVGLIVPHLGRMIVGPNFRYLIPGSLLLGGTYLLFMDNLCRSLFVVEIPLGIATSLVGIPFFLLLMSRKESAW